MIILSFLLSLKYISCYNTSIPSSIINKVFPSDFIFGTSTSAYQVEGGWLDGGKGLSNWDSFSHTPGMIANGDTGDIANDMYHLYPQDIQIMKQQGLKHYRFSISWARILPTGLLPISQEGINYYNDFINQLIENGIEPHVTIFHADIPLALMMYPHNSNPFLDYENFPTWFTDYSQVLFDNFGDRVKQWFTFNEPWCTAVFGPINDSDPYRIAHNAILAHGKTAQLYRTKYQPAQKGTIGIVLNTAHFYPKDPNNLDDVAAAQRAYDFQYGWFIDPLTKGDYPESMKTTVGDRLPKFTSEEKEMIKGSLDFVGLNYYFPYLVSPGTAKESDTPSYWKDTNTTSTFDESWPLSQTGWGIYGSGLRDLLKYTADNYNNIPQYVTENGLAWEEKTVDDAVNDVMRQQYLYDHIEAVGEAITYGVNIKGYFVWSFQDNLEWGSGYQMHFGIIWIERPSLQRVIKDSLRWYSDVLKTFYNQ